MPIIFLENEYGNQKVENGGSNSLLFAADDRIENNLKYELSITDEASETTEQTNINISSF